MRLFFAATMMVVGYVAAIPVGDARETAPQRRCVLREHVAAAVVRDDGLVYFRAQPDSRQSYIARFKGRACDALNPFASLIVETSAAGYCEGDTVRVQMTPGQLAGPRCVIDHLEPFAGNVDDPVPVRRQGE